MLTQSSPSPLRFRRLNSCHPSPSARDAGPARQRRGRRGRGRHFRFSKGRCAFYTYRYAVQSALSAIAVLARRALRSERLDRLRIRRGGRAEQSDMDRGEQLVAHAHACSLKLIPVERRLSDASSARIPLSLRLLRTSCTNNSSMIRAPALLRSRAFVRPTTLSRALPRRLPASSRLASSGPGECSAPLSVPSGS